MEQHLDLRLVASFLVVADELNFTRAAKRLHMTQPPLSLQIKQLENQVGAMLFERSNRRVRLTAAGEALRVEAEKIFAQEHRARQLVSRVGRGEEGGHLAIGFTAVPSFDFVSQLLRQFNARMAGLLYSLRETQSATQIAALLANELDVAFVRPPVVDSRLSAHWLLSEPHVLVMAEDHLLARQSTVQVKDLHQQDFVSYERRAGRYVHDLIKRWLSENDVEPARTHDVEHHNAMMAAVRAGLGIAVVPASAGMLLGNGTTFRRFAGPPAPEVELWIATRKETANPMTAVFVKAAREFAVSYSRSLIPR